MELKTMYITNNVEVAKIAENYGVDRIWIDLEKLGKEERQKNLNSVKSDHKISDIKKMKPYLKKAELLVRVNPINSESQKEINEVIAAGADMIMLPMWKTVEEVIAFIKYVDGRVTTTLLLETKEGVECLDEVLELKGINEIHIGLNDLHLSYNLKFMFELLTNGVVETICRKIKKHRLPYGFGGIARIGEGTLPAEEILEEHFRLGSTRVILSRSFCNTNIETDLKEIELIFKNNMQKLFEVQSKIETKSLEELEKNRKNLKKKVMQIIESK